MSMNVQPKLLPGIETQITFPKTTEAAPAKSVDAAAISQPSSATWQTVKTNDVSSTRDVQASPIEGAENPQMPEALKIRTFNLGKNGPSFQVIENFGATVAQITTADKKDLLWTNAKEGSYKRVLGGAGAIGGIPIVAPAGRTLSQDGKPLINHEGETVVEFTDAMIGAETGRIPTGGRVPKDIIATGNPQMMSHGAVFTSQAWSEPEVQALGDSALKATYTLNFEQDDVLKKMGKGRMEVTYTMGKNDQGQVIFDSDIKVTSKDGKPVYIGALAQHNFFETNDNDTLQSSATHEAEAKEGHQELPTGNIIPISDDNNFQKAKAVHSVEGLEAVVTGFNNGVPSAILNRPEQKLKIEVQAAGVSSHVPGFDGLLLCNKGGKDKLMLEPIARYPNIFNVYENSNRRDIKPVVVDDINNFRAQSRIIATAA